MTALHLVASPSGATPTSPQGARLGATDPIQAFADASNALAMAAYYLRQPAANVPGATRKAVQALAALRRLDAMVQGGAV
jgi:hypothetical protein